MKVLTLIRISKVIENMIGCQEPINKFLLGFEGYVVVLINADLKLRRDFVAEVLNMIFKVLGMLSWLLTRLNLDQPVEDKVNDKLLHLPLLDAHMVVFSKNLRLVMVKSIKPRDLRYTA